MANTILIYKYLPFTEGALKVLSEGTIKFSKASEFNDPFDSAPEHSTLGLKKYIDSRPDLLNKVAELNGYNRKELKKNKPEMIDRLKEAIEKGDFDQPASDTVGICSFSRAPLNLLMWAHYASNHTGFVVEFEIPLTSISRVDEIALMRWLIPHKVKYSSHKPVISFTDNDQTKLNKQFLTKGIDWKYEQEERVIDYIRGSGIHEYNRKKILRSVFTGIRMTQDNFQRIESIINNLNSEKSMNVRLFKVSPVIGEYRLSVERRADLDNKNIT